MQTLKTLFAIIGLLAVIGLVSAGILVKDFDPKARDVYAHMIGTLVRTGDIARATVYKVQVEKGIRPDEIVESLNSVANEMGIKPVGDLPLSKEVEARTGKQQPYVRVLSYCHPNIAVRMVKFSMAYGAYLPCRIVVMEDDDHRYWLYALDMDMMIHGGHPLPPRYAPGREQGQAYPLYYDGQGGQRGVLISGISALSLCVL